MKTYNKIYGTQNEILAQNYLKQNGYKIITNNFITKLGEIDIIANKDNTIIFIEVKYRINDTFGLPREAVTSYKQNKIRTVATIYLRKNNLMNSAIRFDVIEILNDNLTHIQNAF